MGKIIGLIVIVIIVVIGFQKASDMFDSTAGPSRKSMGKVNSQGSLAPIRPFFDEACKRHNCVIVSYEEPAMYRVDITVRGPDRNSVNEFLDELMTPPNNIVKDMDLNKTKYWQTIENGSQVHYASYSLRAYK